MYVCRGCRPMHLASLGVYQSPGAADVCGAGRARLSGTWRARGNGRDRISYPCIPVAARRLAPALPRLRGCIVPFAGPFPFFLPLSYWPERWQSPAMPSLSRVPVLASTS